MKNLLSTTEVKKFLNSKESLEEEYNIKILFAYVKGSHMYGTSHDKSDVDICFIYQQPTEEILKDNYLPFIGLDNNNLSGFEIQRYIELLRLNNPNILESLSVPEECVILKDSSMDVFVPEKWLSKLTKNTVLGYATSQIKKSTGHNKKMNKPVEYRSTLDFCYIIDGYKGVPFRKWYNENKDSLEYSGELTDDIVKSTSNWGLVKVNNTRGIYAIFIDDGSYHYRGIIKNEDSSQLRTSSIPKEAAEIQEPFILFFNEDESNIHKKDYESYQRWLKERNEERHILNSNSGQNYDVKNGSHMFRILEQCLKIAREGKMDVKVNDMDYFLKIKKGGVSYEELLETSDRMVKEIDYYYSISELPETPDINYSKELLYQFRDKNIK